MIEPVPGALDLRQTRAWLHAIRETLPMFTVYDHPTDAPDYFVARLWTTLPRPAVSSIAILDRDLERIRNTMEALGLHQLARQDGDDPKILETWI